LRTSFPLGSDTWRLHQGKRAGGCLPDHVKRTPGLSRGGKVYEGFN
jgi:hypothetical protein